MAVGLVFHYERIDTFSGGERPARPSTYQNGTEGWLSGGEMGVLSVARKRCSLSGIDT